MNKLKHLIIVALIAMLSCGVAVGCTTDSSIPADQPHKVVFAQTAAKWAVRQRDILTLQTRRP